MMEDTQITVYPGAVVGYRAWRLRTARLYPVSRLSEAFGPWQRLNQARCRRAHAGERGGVPYSQCHCGLYALYSPQLLQVGLGYIEGAVLCWGDAQLHGDGLRCQYAKPLALLISPKHILFWPSAWLASRRYQIPLFFREQKMISYSERQANTMAERPSAERRLWEFSIFNDLLAWRRSKA